MTNAKIRERHCQEAYEGYTRMLKEYQTAIEILTRIINGETQKRNSLNMSQGDAMAIAYVAMLKRRKDDDEFRGHTNMIGWFSEERNAQGNQNLKKAIPAIELAIESLKCAAQSEKKHMKESRTIVARRQKTEREG